MTNENESVSPSMVISKQELFFSYSSLSLINLLRYLHISIAGLDIIYHISV